MCLFVVVSLFAMMIAYHQKTTARAYLVLSDLILSPIPRAQAALNHPQCLPQLLPRAGLLLVGYQVVWKKSSIAPSSSQEPSTSSQS
jgi:hypothetical protein